MRLLRLAAVPAALLAAACVDLFVPAATGSAGTADIEAAWQIVDSVYPYLAFKGIDWDAIHTTYRARAAQARGDEIALVLHDLLAELRDGHVYVRAPHGGWETYPWVPPRQRRDRYAYSPFVVRRYFDRELTLSPNGKIEYGVLPGDIGYAMLADFHATSMSADFPGVLETLRGTTGLILDVRQRRGGNYDQVEAVVSWFLTTPLPRPDLYQLGTKLDPPDFQPRGPAPYTNPVVVLTNGSTFSAGELFTEIMKQLPQVTALGDTTGGGSVGSDEDEAPGLHRLPSGRSIYVGTIDLRRYDRLPWEWLGVPPDIRIAQSASDVAAGRDPQLEAAIALLGGSPAPAASHAR